jgi:hypothetical protein
MQNAEVHTGKNVQNVLDFERIKQFRDDRNLKELIRLFWHYADMDSIEVQGETGTTSEFYKRLRYQYHRLKREITEKYLVKINPFIEVLLKGNDIALRFEQTQDPDLINEWSSEVSSFVFNKDWLTPLINTTYEHRNNGNKYYLCFTEDLEHSEESFILANGFLSNYLISFDLILELSRDWLISEYRKRYSEIDEEFKKRRNLSIQYVLFIIKRYGPTGAVALQNSFSETNANLTKWAIVKFKPGGLPFSNTSGQFLDLYGKTFPGFAANASLCCMYDLIYSGEGIIRPVRAIQEMVPPDRYGCIVLFYDQDYPRDETDQKFLDGAIIKSIYDPEKVKNALEKSDFSPLIRKHAKHCCMPEKTGSLKKFLVKDVENELLDLAYELGGISSTLMTNACYIGKKVLGIDLPDDFEPYGKLFVMSDSLSRNIHSLELRALAGSIAEKPTETHSTKDSTLGNLGSLLKNYSKEEVRLAAVYLMRGHIPKNFSDEERNEAEKILQGIEEEGRTCFSA